MPFYSLLLASSHSFVKRQEFRNSLNLGWGREGEGAKLASPVLDRSSLSSKRAFRLGLARRFHHDWHSRSLASACRLNSDGKAFGNYPCRHFVEHHAIAFVVRLEPAGRHGRAAVSRQQPELIDFVFRQRSQIAGHY